MKLFRKLTTFALTAIMLFSITSILSPAEVVGTEGIPSATAPGAEFPDADLATGGGADAPPETESSAAPQGEATVEPTMEVIPASGNEQEIPFVEQQGAAPEIGEIHIPANMALGVGERHPLSATYLPADAENTLTYSTSNSKVASIDAKGLIKAKANSGSWGSRSAPGARTARARYPSQSRIRELPPFPPTAR